MKDETLKINPLICDPVEGICEIPGDATDTTIRTEGTDARVKVVYFTDPICSSCWGIEPQLRKLKLEYGHLLEIEYRMGGLLPDWSYNSGGISQPSDVAGHWDEVSRHYDMPIDGDVWLEDPLHSSYPPSIAFKAAQLQDTDKAVSYLRVLREMLFLEKKNITKWEHMEAAARAVGLNVEQLKSDYEGQAKAHFDGDLKMAKEYGVRGFPSIFFADATGNTAFVYGTKPYAFYEMVILKLNAHARKREYRKDWETLFSTYDSLTAKEFAELSGTPRDESETLLDKLSDKGILSKHVTKNGAIWRR